MDAFSTSYMPEDDELVFAAGLLDDRRQRLEREVGVATFAAVVIGEADARVDDVHVQIAHTLEPLTIETVPNGVLTTPTTLAIEQLGTADGEGSPRRLHEVDARHGPTSRAITEALDELPTLIRLLALRLFLTLPLLFFTAALLQLTSTPFCLLTLEALHPKRGIEGRRHALDVRDGRALVEERLEDVRLWAEGHLLMVVDQWPIIVDSSSRYAYESIQAFLEQIHGLTLMRGTSRIRIRDGILEGVISVETIAHQVPLHAEAKKIGLRLSNTGSFGLTPLDLEDVPTALDGQSSFDRPRLRT